MDRGHGAIVPGVHGLQHVQHFSTTNFAQNNAVWPHPQTVAQQCTLGDFTLAFDVLRAGFHAHHMGLLQLQLRGILNGDDPLIMGNTG